MRPSIAIVGGGFSGTLALANIVAQAASPLDIEWFEATGALAKGVAYGTTDPIHLLNVRASRMGAFAESHEHFFRWLNTPEGKEKSAALWPGRVIDEESYVPRMLYAAYLDHIRQSALAAAKAKHITVRTHRALVTDATSGNRITLATSGGNITTDAVVLATGNLPPRRFAFADAISAHYVADVWNAPEQLSPAHLAALPADAMIVIIGTGLTTVDAILTLKKRGYKGRITALSRGGFVPACHEHSKPYPAWGWVKDPACAPRTAFGLLVGMRAEVRRAEEAGYHWQAVVDSIRPVTQTLWKQLPLSEQKRFLRKLFTLWNIHRHRMAHDIHSQLSALQRDGTLTIRSATIQDARLENGKPMVTYRARGKASETIPAALVINCTGPDYALEKTGHALLKNLSAHGILRVGALGVGVELEADGSASGTAPGRFFPMGALLLGELLECTAVPELRGQARAVASAALASIHGQTSQAALVMGA